METLESVKMSKTTARKLYKTMPEFRPSLEETFGKTFFSESVMDRVKTYEDACIENGKEPMNETALRSAGLTESEIVRRKLVEITKALNGDWVADIFDVNQKKFYAWFNTSSGVFVFRATGCYYSDAGAGSGSRLWFSNPEHAAYAAKQFAPYYKILAEN